MKNILEYFEKTVQKYPDKLAFTDTTREAAFQETMANAKAVGTFLSQQGTRRPVAVLIEKTGDIRCQVQMKIL